MVHLCSILPILCIIIIIQYVQANNTSIPNYYKINNGLSLKKSFRELFQTSSACSNQPIPVTGKQRNVTVNFTSTEKPSSGNCTNNLTDPSAITAGASVTESEPSSDEPSKQPIVTFDEWTKEKLKQEQRKAAPAPATPTPDVRPPTPTRNYASKECGAKILLTNSEAENSKAILNDKEQDEYMRNPCNKADSKFIILELCETIQPQQIILGNSELFSSGPKDIRIFAAERTGGDWIPIGNFTAADNRQLQTFSIENRQYAKLLKIELLSHYGSEHYCTLSVLKVMGSSIVDEYEYEAHLATVEPAKPSISSQSEDPSAAIVKPQEESELKEEMEKNNDKSKEIAEIKESNVVVAAAKKYKPFDISLCKVCTISPSCIVPIHLCWVFVWRPPPKNTTVFPTTSLALPARRLFSEKRRRRRIAFHQRQMFKKKEAVILPAILKSEVKAVVEIVEEEKQEELVTTSPPIIQPAANEALPAASVSHKESVFMKLNKRIAALELNMSLSSEYLSELSRQYVAQTDEHKKHLEQARKTAQEVAEGVELRLNHTIAERLSLMRKEMDSLAEWLHSMRLTASELSISQFSWQLPQRDKCSSDDTTAVKHYIHIEDLPSANWTLSEAVILAIVAQIFTVFFGGLAIYYMNRKKQAVVGSELEKLIQLKVEEILEAKMAQPAHPAINKKKRKKRNRPVNHLNYPSTDSAASQSTTASQTETSSEAESSKVNLPSKIQSCVDQEERSEEERPWVSVKRKNLK